MHPAAADGETISTGGLEVRGHWGQRSGIEVHTRSHRTAPFFRANLVCALHIGSRAAVLRRSERRRSSLHERRRSRRLPRRDPRGASAASGAIRLGSRAAVLRRSERRRSSLHERRRSRRLPRRDPRVRCSCRRSAGEADETDRKQRWSSRKWVSSDPTKTAAPRRTSQRAQRAIRHSERSERSNQARIARRRAEEERAEASSLRRHPGRGSSASRPGQSRLPPAAQPSRCEQNDDLARRHGLSAFGQCCTIVFGDDVVVITLKSASGDANPRREVMQLLI
jgi:hypothetical protein